MKENYSEEKINEKIKELVIARINARMSSNLKLAIGSEGSLNKEEMMEHVKNWDDIGKKIAQTHLNFIKAQATGKLITALNSV